MWKQRVQHRQHFRRTPAQRPFLEALLQELQRKHQKQMLVSGRGIVLCLIAIRSACIKPSKSSHADQGIRLFAHEDRETRHISYAKQLEYVSAMTCDH